LSWSQENLPNPVPAIDPAASVVRLICNPQKHRIRDHAHQRKATKKDGKRIEEQAWTDPIEPCRGMPRVSRGGLDSTTTAAQRRRALKMLISYVDNLPIG